MSLERHIDLAQLGVFMSAKKPFPLRVPTDVKAWMKEQDDLNGSSQNSEVIRALRAAMARGGTNVAGE